VTFKPTKSNRDNVLMLRNRELWDFVYFCETLNYVHSIDVLVRRNM